MDREPNHYHVGDRTPVMRDRREWPRFRFDGEAIWKIGNVEHRRRLLNLSIGGVAIAGDDPAIGDRDESAIGDRLVLTFVLEERLQLGPLEVEVVHKRGGAIGLKFVNPSAALLQRLHRLTEDLAPLP